MWGAHARWRSPQRTPGGVGAGVPRCASSKGVAQAVRCYRGDHNDDVDATKHGCHAMRRKPVHKGPVLITV